MAKSRDFQAVLFTFSPGQKKPFNCKIRVPRDRNGEFQFKLLQKNINEIEQKIIAMYAKGASTRDIQEMLEELYGIDVSASMISKITDKAWELVEAWQNRP